MAYLYSWLGNSDIRLIEDPEHPGPLCQALLAGKPRRAYILSNAGTQVTGGYVKHLTRRLNAHGVECSVTELEVDLEDPTDYQEIYLIVHRILQENPPGTGGRVFHLSPGTPAMAALWIVFSQSSFPARLIQSSREQGIRDVNLPFELEARNLPGISSLLSRLMAEEERGDSAFSHIVHSHDSMKRLISRARKASAFDIPVLVMGESGTGKELISRALHNSGPRKDAPFVSINCGAIPRELMESELFGHVRGAFTGAEGEHLGAFRQAQGGSLFLDEIGELPPDLQVKLLRVLQDGEVKPLGAAKPVATDVRVIAATNRYLPGEIHGGRFRADLFYRLAVAILQIPPLRDRRKDIRIITEYLLNEINDEFRSVDPQWELRTLHADALEFIDTYSWPGNIRQLSNTLKQAALWSETHIISREEIMDLLSFTAGTPRAAEYGEFSRTAGLRDELDEIAKTRIIESLERNRWQIGNTARDLGFSNHQTLSNWMKRLKISYNENA